MSNGDGKDSVVKLSIDKDSSSIQQCSSSSSKRKKRSSGFDDFAQGIARIATAQVCEGLGFQSFQPSALDKLADVGVRYIKEIGKVASLYANLANRSECNVFDVIQGLEDLGSVQGFQGASDVGRSVANSGVVKDISRYVCKTDEIPFAYSVPSFPVVKERTTSSSLSFEQAGESPPDECIPSWLPKYPDSATYTKSDSGEEKDLETQGDDKIQQGEMQYGNLEKSSVNVQQNIPNWSESGAPLEQGDAGKALRAAESNPFVAPPLQFGDKEVSLPVLPAKLLDSMLGNRVMENHVTVHEPKLQANEATRNGTCETEDRKKILLNGRPSVHFKFRDRKKSLGTDTIPRKEEGIQKISFWFSDDQDSMIEKKSRTEQILSENMENPLELTQL